MTDAEQLLWYHLRARRFEQWKFRRQVPVGPYVADFLCKVPRVIVEIDGGQHADAVVRDEARSAWLRSRGYEVVRFWNSDVMGNTEGVLETLLAALVRR